MAFVIEVELRHDLVKWIDWYTNDNNHRFCERITRYMIYFEEQGEENRSERALHISEWVTKPISRQMMYVINSNYMQSIPYDTGATYNIVFIEYRS